MIRGRGKVLSFLDMYIFCFSCYNSDWLCGRYVKGPNVHSIEFFTNTLPSASGTERGGALGGITEAF